MRGLTDITSVTKELEIPYKFGFKRVKRYAPRVVEINFSQLDPARAARLDRVPTSFHLPEEEVDLVAQAGTDALLAHPTVRAVLGRANSASCAEAAMVS